MTTDADRGGQWTAKQDRDNLSLIPPLAEEFTLYGGDEIVARARKWALDHHFLLADGIPACAHGLYLLSSCPKLSTCRNSCRQLDHARIWVPASHSFDDRPFLLVHPYANEIATETQFYANAHGLDVGSYREFGDSWYGSGTIPIRLTIPANWPVWPIEAKAAILLDTQPVAWPDGTD
jgi:hypothetical protein